MRPKLGREHLLGLLAEYEKGFGCLPRAVDMQRRGVCDKTFAREFGSWRAALAAYQGVPFKKKGKARHPKFPTTLVVPDAHVGPGQDLSRFDALSKLINDRFPSRIIFMGDFVTVEALSNWDLQKSGVMEGKRY